MVGGTWKGISYLRALPAHVNDANSIPQQSTRMKMSLVMALLGTCTEFIRRGFQGYAQKMSAFNAATSYNFHNAFSGEYPDLQLDFSKLLLSRGSLTGGDNVGCASTEAGSVDFSWDDNTASGTASAGDAAMLLVHNPAKKRSVYLIQGALRSDAAATLELPVDFSGDEVHCYLAFADLVNLMGKQPKSCISDSAYAGSVVVA